MARPNHVCAVCVSFWPTRDTHIAISPVKHEHGRVTNASIARVSMRPNFKREREREVGKPGPHTCHTMQRPKLLLPLHTILPEPVDLFLTRPTDRLPDRPTDRPPLSASSRHRRPTTNPTIGAKEPQHYTLRQKSALTDTDACGPNRVVQAGV